MFAVPTYRPETRSYEVHLRIPIYDRYGAHVGTKHVRRVETRTVLVPDETYVYPARPTARATRQTSSQASPPPPRQRRHSYAAPRDAEPRTYRHLPATEADRRRAGIPEGYDLRKWDPEEDPILLVGSAFDAYSLGKWMYQWAVYAHGANSKVADTAGDLWRALIRLTGKTKMARERLGGLRSSSDRETVTDFVRSSERLMQRFDKVLRKAEERMVNAKERDGGFGENAGVEFVMTCFEARDHARELTGIIDGVNLWLKRFDVNCKKPLDTASRTRGRQV